MKLSRKKRDILIIIAALIIILIILGFFLFWPEESAPPQIQESVGDFSITGNFIENKEEGLSLLAPEGWIIKDYGAAGIGIFSPEIEFDENGGFLQSAKEKGGCIIGVEIRREIDDLELLTSFITKIKDGSAILEDDGVRYQLISASSKDALETIFLKDNKEIYISVEVPIDNTIYEFNNGMIFSDKCIEEFNKILDTVVINR